jgi:hypothetical protein
LKAAVCALVLLATPVATAAEEPSLATVLNRAAAYVAEFHRVLAGVVAEERYQQEVIRYKSGPDLVTPVKQDLLSDLLLVRPSLGGEYVEFRDVAQVNRIPVRDRGDRLTKLFLAGTPSAKVQIGEILDESSRFNIGNIERNINTPLFALQILELANQERFKFKRSKYRVPAIIATEMAKKTAGEDRTAPTAFHAAAEVWSIEFEETRDATLVRTEKLKDIKSHGRFWIDRDNGRVLMSELIVKNRAITATVDVSYQSEPLVGMLVPIEMRENYQDNRGAHIVGTATYGRFRQFQVNVGEQFLIKK